MPTRITAVCALAFVVVTGGVAGTVQVPPNELPSTADEPTTIAECTVVTEPGSYVLGTDLAGGDERACLSVEAANGTVSIDGAGYSVTGGIEVVSVETQSDGTNARLDLRDVAVDTLTYPDSDTDRPGASGMLDHVTVETLDVTNVFEFTVESSRVEDRFTGLFASRVAFVNSTFAGGFSFDENTGLFVLENNTFGGDVFFFEELFDSSVTENTFEGAFGLFPAGFPPTNVTVASNVFTDGDRTGDETIGASSDRITIEGGDENVIRDNVVVGGAAGVSIIEGEQNVIENNTVRDTEVGVRLIATSDTRIVGNAIGSNDVGIDVGSANPTVRNNDITDNRVGIEVTNDDASPTIRENVVVGNEEFGVRNTVGDIVVDARNNVWGANDGPSSAPANDSDAPFADPVTGALANGTGDAVGEGDTPGVSNVRFDPFLVDDETGPEPKPNPEPEPKPEPEPEPSPDTNATYYQFDVVAGPVIERFGAPDSDQFYNDQSRLVEYFHASVVDGRYDADRIGRPDELYDAVDQCVTVRQYGSLSFRPELTTEFVVAEGCSVELTFAVYEKPGPGWSRASASEQRLVDYDTGTFGPGTHRLTVSVAENGTEAEDATDHGTRLVFASTAQRQATH